MQKEIARRIDYTRKTIRRALQEPTDKEYERSTTQSKVDKYHKEDIKRWIREDVPVSSFKAIKYSFYR